MKWPPLNRQLEPFSFSRAGGTTTRDPITTALLVFPEADSLLPGTSLGETKKPTREVEASASCEH